VNRICCVSLVLIFGALGLPIVAEASVTFSVPQSSDAGLSPFVHAGAQAPNSSGQVQNFGPSSEDPFDHSATASDSNSFGSEQAFASLDISFNENGIISTGASSASSTDDGAQGLENFYAYIIVSDEPVSFTLTASTSAMGEGQADIYLEVPGGGTVRYDSGLSLGDPASGTATGVLFPGTYAFSQSDATDNSAYSGTVTSGSGNSSTSVDLQFTPVPEPKTSVALAIGCCFIVFLFGRRKLA